MATRRNGAVLRSLQVLFEGGSTGGLSDAQLLERFRGGASGPAESAFAALVERHGPMVLRVCRRVLRDSHEAEDAFQATFLVLARRARALWVGDSLGPWLHGVAFRVASCARAAEARRRRHERRFAAMVAERVSEAYVDDLGLVLHGEIERLPAKYRAPVILVHVAGLSHEQAAERLALPVGTVRSRLARGRERLRARLVRRGIAPSVGMLAILSTDEAQAVPEALACATVRAAVWTAAGKAGLAGAVSAPVAALTEGVLKLMFLNKLKISAAALLATGVVAVGATVLAQQPLDVVPRAEKPSTSSGSTTDRLGQLEAKLDRLLKVLEGQRPPGTPPPAGGWGTSSSFVPVQIPPPGALGAAAGSSPVVASTPPVSYGAGVVERHPAQALPVPAPAAADLAPSRPGLGATPHPVVSGTTPPPAGSVRFSPPDAERLRNVERRLDLLEQKLDRLLKRLDAGGGGPAGGPAGAEAKPENELRSADPFRLDTRPASTPRSADRPAPVQF